MLYRKAFDTYFSYCKWQSIVYSIESTMPDITLSEVRPRDLTDVPVTNSNLYLAPLLNIST